MSKYYITTPKRKHFIRIPKKYDVGGLNNREIAADFEIRIGGAFEPIINSNLQVEELYETFVTTTNRITEETVGYKKRKQI